MEQSCPRSPIGGGTLGAQAGYESADVLALVVSDAATKALAAGNFKIGVTPRLSPGPWEPASRPQRRRREERHRLLLALQWSLRRGHRDGMTVSSDDEAIRALYGTQADLVPSWRGAPRCRKRPMRSGAFWHGEHGLRAFGRQPRCAALSSTSSAHARARRRALGPFHGVIEDLDPSPRNRRRSTGATRWLLVRPIYLPVRSRWLHPRPAARPTLALLKLLLGSANAGVLGSSVAWHPRPSR